MEFVAIPQSFFLREAKAEYYDHKSRLITELLQNSLDAGATEVRLTITNTAYTCADNGRGMTKERMVSALLTMGGSDKLAGSTGGFGAAKKLLLFAHKSFAIHSLATAVEGAGLAYNFVVRGYNNGTTVSAEFSNPDDWTNLETRAREFLMRCDFRNKCKIFINGAPFASFAYAPYAKTIAGLGEVFAGKKDKGCTEVWVRHNGLFMFRRHVTNLNHRVIVEVKGNSVDMFTQSRESFRDAPDKLFDELIAHLTIDKESFIKPKPRKFVVSGADTFIRFIAKECLTNLTPEMMNVIHSLKTMAAKTTLTAQEMAQVFKTQTAGMAAVEDKAVIEKVERLLGTDLATDFHFDLADSSWRKVRPAFIPNSGKPKYTNLAKLWKVCVREVLKANGLDQNFVIGFTFSSTAGATHQKQNGVSCYLINPKSDTFDKGTKQNKVMSALTTAVHEVVHSQGYSYHDEQFVRKFHELLTPTLVKGPTWRQLVKLAKVEKV